MNQKSLKDVAALVRQRLLNLARERGEDFGLVLVRYATERLLYRLGRSPHADTFVVKGAVLFSLWSGEPHRSTRDLDLLGSGPADESRMEGIFRDLCAAVVEEDGLVFDAGSVSAGRIADMARYAGVRVKLLARLGVARIPMQVDVGFGDAVSPRPRKVKFPVMLDMPPPRLRAYPRETVVAEKLEALVDMGMANSRMKDFYDLWYLAGHFDFTGEPLVRAIRKTFKRRATPLPSDVPVALTGAFSGEDVKRTQWAAFLRKTGLGDASLSLEEVVDSLRSFLESPLRAAREIEPFDGVWQPGGSW
jgi:predicted nucleotidyltransferase component of viral defense system